MQTFERRKVLLCLVLVAVAFPLINGKMDLSIRRRGIARLTSHLNSVLRNAEENTLFSTNALQTGLTAAWIAAKKKSNTSKRIHQISNVDGDDKEAASRVNRYLKIINNKIFVNEHFELNPKRSSSFKSDKRLSAKEVKIDMSSDVAEMINNIVANDTNNKIQNIFPKGTIDADTTVIFLSITDYMFEWVHPFKPFGKEAFINAHKSTLVNFLYQGGEFLYSNIPEWDATAVEIPIKDKKRNTRLLLLMPNKLNRLEKLKDNVFSKDLGKLQKYLIKRRVILLIPELKMLIENQIKQALIQLNMTEAFKGNAEFNELHSNNVDSYIKDFRHDAHIQFTEEGVRGSAVTALQWEVVSYPATTKTGPLKQTISEPGRFHQPYVSGPKIIQFNRPFIFAVLEKAQTTTRVWFIGTVINV